MIVLLSLLQWMGFCFWCQFDMLSCSLFAHKKYMLSCLGSKSKIEELYFVVLISCIYLMGLVFFFSGTLFVTCIACK